MESGEGDLGSSPGATTMNCVALVTPFLSQLPFPDPRSGASCMERLSGSSLCQMLTSLFLWLPCSSMARLPESPSVHLILRIGSRDCLCPGICSRVLLTIFGCRHCISRSVLLLPFCFYLGLLLGFLEEKPSSPTAHPPPQASVSFHFPVSCQNSWLPKPGKKAV